jgi:hypothetical protein
VWVTVHPDAVRRVFGRPRVMPPIVLLAPEMTLNDPEKTIDPIPPAPAEMNGVERILKTERGNKLLPPGVSTGAEHSINRAAGVPVLPGPIS